MGKHLEFYKQSAADSIMFYYGLCRAADEGVINKDIFELFKPTKGDIDVLVQEKELLDCTRDGFWGAGVPIGHAARNRGFTPLRQTIVLFMAAINNEL